MTDNLIITYKYIAIISTVLFIIKFIIFSFADTDSEVTGDFNTISDSDASFDFLSIQSILAFLMGFGWVGLAAVSQWHLSIKFVILSSMASGTICMLISAYLMLKVKGLNHIIKIDYEKSIGKSGRAYTAIHPHKEGQIEIEINGRLSIKQAINDTDTEINSFEQIIIIRAEDDKLYGKKI